MKTKDLVEFLEQFNPDSEAYFVPGMFNVRKVLVPGVIALGVACGEGVPDAPAIHLDSTGITEMPEEIVQFWEDRFAEAKVQR